MINRCPKYVRGGSATGYLAVLKFKGQYSRDFVIVTPMNTTTPIAESDRRVRLGKRFEAASVLIIAGVRGIFSAS